MGFIVGVDAGLAVVLYYGLSEDFSELRFVGRGACAKKNARADN
jgi:hypothetical protein